MAIAADVRIYLPYSEGTTKNNEDTGTGKQPSDEPHDAEEDKSKKTGGRVRKEIHEERHL